MMFWSFIHPVRSRVDSFHRRVTCEKRKSLFFCGLFWQNKVREIHRDFVGVFNKTINPLVIVGYEMIIECFYMTSRRPYWCPKTMKRRPYWCPKPVLWELNSFLMQTLSFVPIHLHRWWPRGWKHSISNSVLRASLATTISLPTRTRGIIVNYMQIHFYSL